MVCQLTVAATTTVLLIAGAAAQANQEQRKIDVVLLGGVPSEKIHITYYLYGPFGAYGNFITPRPSTPSYRISTYVNGRPAGQIKGSIWASGCRMMTFDDLLVGSANVQEFFSCSPSGTINLAGRIRGAPLSKKPVEVRVDYMASWACSFFGLADCMVPQIELGTTTPDAEGTFEIELPDFSADPISSGSEGGAQLHFVLREVRGNLVAFLEPETAALRTPGGALKIIPSYPQNLSFSVRKIH